MITKEKVVQQVLEELNEALEGVRCECEKIVDKVDLEQQTITITFSFQNIPEDDYYGLASY